MRGAHLLREESRVRPRNPGDQGSGGREFPQVQSRGDAHILQEVDQVLGGEVATGTRSERAAAQAAYSGVEIGDADQQRGQHVRHCRVAGVVQVKPDGGIRAERPNRLDQRKDAVGGRSAYGVRQRESIAAGGDKLRRYGGNCGGRGGPVERAVEGGGDNDFADSARGVDQIDDRFPRLHGLLDALAGVRAGMAVGGGNDVLQMVYSGRERSLSPAITGHERAELDFRPAVQFLRQFRGVR